MEYVADPERSLLTVESAYNDPIVRIEYEQALAIGTIGGCLSATKHKHWGPGPSVLPLEPDDWFYPDRITYVFKENSLYNRRFHQRRRMKKLLGVKRALVKLAMSNTKEMFLQNLAKEHRRTIQRVFGVSAGVFWRASKGKHFLELPREREQLEFDFDENESPQ